MASAYDSLTQKQKLFVNAYLASGNATQAAKDAGYCGTRHTLARIGAENLGKLGIKEALKERGEQEKASIMTANEALERVTRMALSAESENVRFKAAALLGKRYGAWKDEQDKERLLLEISVLKEELRIKTAEREEAERKAGDNAPTVQEGRFYPAGGQGVGPCGCYHYALDASIYPSSPLIALVVEGEPCPLCGELLPDVPITPLPSAEELAEREDDAEPE